MMSLVYKTLLGRFGRQGWWPLSCLKLANPKKTGSVKGYHPGDYSFPKSRKQRFEICSGAILTQNTSWKNAEKAVVSLKEKGFLSPEKIMESSPKSIVECIKPAGYYNQKERKLRIFSEFFISLGSRKPSRKDLLGIWGIGPETSDSILLYAYKEPVFVIDAYTKRIMKRLGFGNIGYNELQNLFHKNVRRNHRIYNEFHALLVELAKRHCKSVPDCGECPLSGMCKKKI